MPEAANKTSEEVPEKIDLGDLESQIAAGMKGHNWRQKGPYLVCESCKVKHAVFLGLTKYLKQVKSDGELVIEKIPILKSKAPKASHSRGARS